MGHEQNKKCHFLDEEIKCIITYLKFGFELFQQWLIIINGSILLDNCMQLLTCMVHWGQITVASVSVT